MHGPHPVQNIPNQDNQRLQRTKETYKVSDIFSPLSPSFAISVENVKSTRFVYPLARSGTTEVVPSGAILVNNNLH
jgi:hypothetical protein